MTKSLPMERMDALGVLGTMPTNLLSSEWFPMLHDPNEAICWRVRSNLRSGYWQQKLGSDPDA